MGRLSPLLALREGPAHLQKPLSRPEVSGVSDTYLNADERGGSGPNGRETPNDSA